MRRRTRPRVVSDPSSLRGPRATRAILTAKSSHCSRLGGGIPTSCNKFDLTTDIDLPDGMHTIQYPCVNIPRIARTATPVGSFSETGRRGWSGSSTIVRPTSWLVCAISRRTTDWTWSTRRFLASDAPELGSPSRIPLSTNVRWSHEPASRLGPRASGTSNGTARILPVVAGGSAVSVVVSVRPVRPKPPSRYRTRRAAREQFR